MTRPPRPFAERLVRWQRRHGRHELPWQDTRDAYRIWVSEIMLQQTQVAAAIAYYTRFLARFPTVDALAHAPVDDVLALWSGLGYYARGRNLHRAAREVMDRHGGRVPADFEALETLPGVGRSTAAAIAVFASGERRAILDGNVKRVMARHAGIGGDPTTAKTLSRLWQAAEARLPRAAIEAYTQGLMDLGATLCTVRSPACAQCPVARDCVARLAGRIADLPGRKVRVARPLRRVAMLVVRSGAEVLLEKRPAAGIWGGLWSLPEAPVRGDAPTLLRRDWGLAAAHVETLPAFRHAFTHFTLEVTPRVLIVRKPSLKSGDAASRRQGLWLALFDLPGAALPAPVRKLLQGLDRRPSKRGVGAVKRKAPKSRKR